MRITYSIQVCNESRELYSLLNFLIQVIDEEDYIDVIVDSNNKTSKVDMVLNEFKERITIYEKPFESFYENSNYHTEVAKGDFIFFIDADEMPEHLLIQKIKEIIVESGKELLYVPRMNIHPGMTQNDQKEFGFNKNNVGFINWPDYQGRIYKICDYIKWSDELHTKITGVSQDKIGILPKDISFGMWHIKSMEKQKSRWKNNTGEYLMTAPGESLYDLLM